MSKRRMQFPMEVRTGSVTVKIYTVSNMGRDSFTISYFARLCASPVFIPGVDCPAVAQGQLERRVQPAWRTTTQKTAKMRTDTSMENLFQAAKAANDGL
jgi:hypothetical protein